MNKTLIQNMYRNHIRKYLKAIHNVMVDCVDRVYRKYLLKRLTNKDFTILSSNCIGGSIYHRLGMEFLTPTIKLRIPELHFIKFVKNPHYYVNQELVFIETEEEYPVGMLDDIELHFNHSENEEEARRDWDRRKVRINYDNIYIIMMDRDYLTDEDIRQLEQASCKNKIVLSAKSRPDIPYVKTIKPKKRKLGRVYLDKDIFGIRSYEKHFDFVSWLNHQEDDSRSTKDTPA